jgi:hypothetical protein
MMPIHGLILPCAGNRIKLIVPQIYPAEKIQKALSFRARENNIDIIEREARIITIDKASASFHITISLRLFRHSKKRHR